MTNLRHGPTWTDEESHMTLLRRATLVLHLYQARPSPGTLEAIS